MKSIHVEDGRVFKVEKIVDVHSRLVSAIRFEASQNLDLLV